MTGAERGFLLLCSHLGNPQRRPLTAVQLRKLARRAREMVQPEGNRDLTTEDLLPLGYGSEEARRIISLLSEEALLDRYLEKAAKLGCTPLTWLSPKYPEGLRHALGDDAPACLWARGDLCLLEKPGIALVGSRELRGINREFARRAGTETARQGFVLISGNARGADQTAQDAALAAGGCCVSFLADKLTDHVPVPGQLFLSEEDYDQDFSAQRALSRNRCIHALGLFTIAAQATARHGGTWDGSVKNLRFGWSALYVFDDGSEAARLLQQMGAVPIGMEDLQNLRGLPSPIQRMI